MKLNTLKPGRGWGSGRVKWCGPTALAIITGRTLIFCQRALAKQRGIDQRYLKGVTNRQMRRALNAMGFEMVGVIIERNPPSASGRRYMPTLRQYIEEQQTTAQFRSVMLINVTNHYVVAQRGLICDNNRIDPIPVDRHPASRKRIERAWIIRPLARCNARR